MFSLLSKGQVLISSTEKNCLLGAFCQSKDPLGPHTLLPASRIPVGSFQLPPLKFL